MGQKKVYIKKMYTHQGITYDLVRDNGFIHIDPMPSEETIKKLYTDDYFEEDYASGTQQTNYEDAYIEMLPRFKKLHELIIQNLDLTKEGNYKLLEIGCAGGNFLKYLNNHSYVITTYGVELNSTMREKAKLNASDVYDWNVEHKIFDRFDVIVLSHVLEHFTQPHKVIQNCHNALPPKGIIIIEVPCFVSSIWHRILRIICKLPGIPENFKKTFKMPNTGWKPYHLWEYTPTSIKQLLQQTGFTIIHYETHVNTPEVLNKHWPTRIPFKIFKTIIETFKLPGENITIIATKK